MTCHQRYHSLGSVNFRKTARRTSIIMWNVDKLLNLVLQKHDLAFTLF